MSPFRKITSFRPLNDYETKMLAQQISKECSCTSEEEVCLELTDSWVSIAIDGYTSDGPGYFGALYLVIGSGGPELHQLYDKNFEPIDPE